MRKATFGFLGFSLAVAVITTIVITNQSSKPTPNTLEYQNNTESAPTQVVTGYITDIQPGTISVRSADGQTIQFKNNSSTDIEHLKQHESENLPVKVSWKQEANQKIALEISDAH